MSQLRQRKLRATRQSPGDEGSDLPAASLPELPEAVPVCPKGVATCRCRTVAGSARDLAGPADQFFVADARKGGWLCDGGGGIAAYYAANGLIYPEYERKRLNQGQLREMDQLASKSESE